MKADEIERKFERGESIVQHLDLENARRPNLELRRVNVDFPVWMINALDRESERLGVPRQSLIKVLIAEHLDKRAEKPSTARRSAKKKIARSA